MWNKEILVVYKKFSQLKNTIKKIEGDFVFVEETDFSSALTVLESASDFLCVLIEVEKNPSEAVNFISTISFVPELKKLPVIAFSKKTNAGALEALAAAGVYDHIQLPYNPKLLERKLNGLRHLSESVSAIQELEIDELTGVYTRQAFLRKAEALIEKNPDKEYAVMAVDFDNFKFSNSQYGEEKCNEFLAFIGSELKKNTRSGYTGRFGGDQFICIFEYSEEINVDFLTEYVNNGLLTAPIPHQKAKIGVYAPINKLNPVVSCCDKAFLAVKEIKGNYNKNIEFYKDSFQNQLEEEQKILNSMENGLKENQFLVYYQPKHETVTGKIAGCEALVRWNHPEYGFMSPGQFIPLFEKNGFITKLDSYIVKRVCEDILRWQKEDKPIVPVSINISRRDYLEKNWMKSQIEYIDSLKIDHSLIHFEVTESLYAEYMDLIIEQVRKVQKQNFLIEMDDFGAGYSSLGLLATFPLNIIKLDISFVRHIEINEIVIENVIKMAHRMGLSVIAEGAETKEQFKILKALGCDLIQGYCFSKPLSCQDFELYLAENEIKQAKNVPEVQEEKNDSDTKANEALLQAASEVAETVPGGFFSYHADGNLELISFNKELLKIYECESVNEFRELVGNSFEGMVLPEDYQKITQDINNQITSENDIDHVRYRIKTKTGKIKYIDDYGRFVHTNKYGSVYYVFLNDITQIHEQHLEMEKRNEVIQGLSRNYKSIYLIDFETNKMIPYAISEKYKDIMMDMINSGMSYDEVVYAFADGYVAEEEREAIKAISVIDGIQKEFKDKDSFSFLFHLLLNGKVISLAEMTIMKLTDQNLTNRAVLTFRTVSNIINS